MIGRFITLTWLVLNSPSDGIQRRFGLCSSHRVGLRNPREATPVMTMQTVITGKGRPAIFIPHLIGKYLIKYQHLILDIYIYTSKRISPNFLEPGHSVCPSLQFNPSEKYTPCPIKSFNEISGCHHV